MATTAASACPAGAVSADMLGAAQSATVVLHDPKFTMPAEVVARLQANGARVIALDTDPVRMWRTGVGELLAHPDTRLFGLTRWADYLIVKGLAAESRRYARHEQLHAQSGQFTWLIA